MEGEFESLALFHVDFSYGSGHEILRDINLEIKKGQKIALVGYNGAGKTTLVKLLMRLYDPCGGVILRNGVDIRSLWLDEYRKGIGAVFQDYKIYAATLRENVVMDLCGGTKQRSEERRVGKECRL